MVILASPKTLGHSPNAAMLAPMILSRVVKFAEGLLAGVEQDIAGRQRGFGEALNSSVVVARVLASSAALAVESRKLAQ